MYPHQAERLAAALAAAGTDALVASSPANVRYVAGLHSVSQTRYEMLVHAVFTPRGVALVVPGIDAATVAAEGVETDAVICYGESVAEYSVHPGEVGRRAREWTARPAPTAADALATALDALGIRAGAIALDESALSVTAWRSAVERLPALRVVPGAEHLAGARAVKGPYEIDRLMRALHVAEEAVDAVLQMLKPGVTEREAAALYEAEVGKRGAAVSCALITMGERTALAAVLPSDRALHRGDLVRFDVGCVVDGYVSELARTAVLAEPDERQARVYDAIAAAQDAAIGAMRPGASAGRVIDAAVAAARAAGLATYRRHDVGHGIGLEPRERPPLATGDATTLEAGMVLVVDAPYHEHGWGGVNVKDTVLVTTSDARRLNRSSRGLVLLD